MPESTVNARSDVSLAIVGSGGAGVMTTGDLLLSTASFCGLYAVMTRSYGPQIRGGESACFLRLGNKPFEKQADGIDLLVAFDWRNADRFQEELSLSPDAWILYEKAEGDPPQDFLKRKNNLSIDWKELARKVEGGKGRANVLAFGMLCYLLGVKEAAAIKALEDRFRSSDKSTLENNVKSFQAGWRWAGQTWSQRPPFQLPIVEEASPHWVLTGNQGIVIGSLMAGCDFYAGYPITPATDIMEDLSHYLPQRGGVLIQAEDELAAVNMAIGASFGGKKAMTATSGPGFSLMAEGLGLALMAEIPLVVVDVQRAGPSTGVPTKTEQSDLWAALGSSHGDNPRVVLAPSSVRGCIEMTVKAFNIAEAYQVPVILLSDQFLGSRTESMDPIPLDAFKVQKRQLAENLEGSSYRRFDPTGGAVIPIAVPGMAGGEYTADGLEHDDRGWPDASHRMHQTQSDRRLRKLDPLAVEEGWIELCGDPTAAAGFIGWGSTGGVIREAVRTARMEGYSMRGIIPHLLFPPQADLLNRIFDGMEMLYVAELSSMGQFLHYLRSYCQLPPTVVPISRAGGMPFRTSELLSVVKSRNKSQK